MPKKPRLPRVDREEDYHIEDETAHLWAVSYADFLMVLLSFFIIFFSVDEKKQENVINRIVADIGNESEAKGAKGQKGGQGVGQAGKGPGQGKGTGHPKTDSPRNIDSIQKEVLRDVLKNFKLTVEKKEKAIHLKFPDNIYPAGQIHLNNQNRKLLSLVLKKLMPFSNEIDLIFVGHTDSLPMRKNASKVITDNFSLSVIRATRALQLAIRAGYPVDRLAAKGSADKRRSTRTLTLVVQARTSEI